VSPSLQLLVRDVISDISEFLISDIPDVPIQEHTIHACGQWLPHQGGNVNRNGRLSTLITSPVSSDDNSRSSMDELNDILDRGISLTNHHRSRTFSNPTGMRKSFNGTPFGGRRGHTNFSVDEDLSSYTSLTDSDPDMDSLAMLSPKNINSDSEDEDEQLERYYQMIKLKKTGAERLKIELEKMKAKLDEVLTEQNEIRIEIAQLNKGLNSRQGY
jgi:hypothetical protein